MGFGLRESPHGEMTSWGDVSGGPNPFSGDKTQGPLKKSCSVLGTETSQRAGY